jgi:hypothetical protein
MMWFAALEHTPSSKNTRCIKLVCRFAKATWTSWNILADNCSGIRLEDGRLEGRRTQAAKGAVCNAAVNGSIPFGASKCQSVVLEVSVR